MTSAAVEVRRRQALPVTTDQIAIWEQQAERLATSSLVKGGYKNRPDNIIAAAMIGAELGWSLMFSLQNIHSWTTPVRKKVRDPDTRQESWVTEDEPTTAISAQAQLSLLTDAGHSYAIITHSETEVSVVGRRCDRVCSCPTTVAAADTSTPQIVLDPMCAAHYPLTVRSDDPDLAHLVGRGQKGDDDYLPGRKMWKQNPRRMLWWATVRELVSIMCPEVTMGMTASPDDAPHYQPPEPPTAASLDRVERPALDSGATETAPVGDSQAVVEVSEGPGPETPQHARLAGSGPAPPGPRPRSAKAVAMDKVLAGVGGEGNEELARLCWDEMTSKAPWLSYPDPEGWARAWRAENHPPSTIEVPKASDHFAVPYNDDAGQIAGWHCQKCGLRSSDPNAFAATPCAEQCDYVSARDGRRCIRKPHESSNHTLEPKTEPQGVENSEASGEPDNKASTTPPGAVSPDASDEHWDEHPPGYEPFEPPLGDMT